MAYDSFDDAGGQEMTDQQQFLLTLQGTWEGTVGFPMTISGNDRVVITIDLPPGGGFGAQSTIASARTS